MADNTRDKGNPGDSPPDGAALSARLKRLGQRIGETEAHRHPPAVQNASDPSALARGFRLSSELVAGVLVGAGIGWLLDRWLGISPWGMIVFLLLGFAAGVFNVMRAAGVGRPPGSGTL